MVMKAGMRVCVCLLATGLFALGVCTTTQPKSDGYAGTDASPEKSGETFVSPLAKAVSSPSAPAVSSPSARAVPTPVIPPVEPASNSDDYIIGPHDLLEISVFQVEELSRKVRVNSRGMLTLPLIGVVHAAGRTAADVETDIAEKLLECCLQDPQVSIFIQEFVSQRVTVEGEVDKPGVYPLTGRTTLLQAIAMASGAAQLADLADVRVFRDQNDGTKAQLTFDLRDIREGKIADPLIRGNDIVVVGRSGSLSLIKGVTDTLRGFIGFGTVR